MLAVEASAPATRGCRHRGTIHIVRGSYGFIRQDGDADDLIVTRACCARFGKRFPPP